MANFFKQGQQTQKPSPRVFYEQRYKTSRMNLLLVVVFTMVNLILLVTNSNVYFLFSAFIPNFIAEIGMFVCGRFPKELYTEELADMVFLDNTVFVILLIISVALTLLYLLAWYMSSKQRVGWLIFALAFFSLDTLGMLFINGISFDAAFDILFHAYVLYYLIIGVRAHYGLKRAKAEEEAELLRDEVLLGIEQTDDFE